MAVSGGNSSVNSATVFFGNNCEEPNSKLENLSLYILGFCSLGFFIVTKFLLVTEVIPARRGQPVPDEILEEI